MKMLETTMHHSTPIAFPVDAINAITRSQHPTARIPGGQTAIHIRGEPEVYTVNEAYEVILEKLKAL